MINRQNWQDTKRYLYYLEHDRQVSSKTTRRVRATLRQLLEWADDAPLGQARQIDPSFPAYLARLKSMKEPEKTLAPATVHKGLQFVRDFFYFARSEWPTRYKAIKDSWVDLLRPPRHASMESQIVDHQFYTLEDVRRLLSVSAETLHIQRAQAGAAMLFLSAMRTDTLSSLRVNCVDLKERKIMQLPKMGVRTKNNKAGITYLLEIPDMLSVIERWHEHVRRFQPDSLWYAPLSFDGISLVETHTAIEGRGGVLNDDLKMLCDRAGVFYLSPHKLRHGHIMYARSLARNPEEVKAISQNVLHSTTIITDQVYSGLKANQVQNVIANLGTKPENEKTEIMKLIKLLQAQL